MQTLGAVAPQAQLGHTSTHRGHTPLGTAHATAYVHARDLTAEATNRRALRATEGHTPVQRTLGIQKERLSGVAVLPQPCLLCGGGEETPVNMHVGCAHSRLLWPHYRQAVQEAARHLPPRDKALWVALWRSAGAEWTEVFCSGLVPEAAEAQLRAIACYDLLGGTSVDEFLQHMLRLGDFAWELRNNRLEQLLRAPHSAAARVHRWLTVAEGDCPPPAPRPSRDFVASLRLVNGTLECPAKEDPHPHRDVPGGFSKHLRGALFPPWVIGRNSMTAWEARIVGSEWAHEWSWWCATKRTPGTPATQYAAVPLEGWGPHTQPRPRVIRGAGPERPWDAKTTEWLRAALEPHTGWRGDVSSLLRAPLPPPRLVLHTANILRVAEIRTWGCDAATVRWLPPEEGGTRLTVAHFKKGGPTYDDALVQLGDLPGPLLLMLPTNLAAALRRELNGYDRLKVGWEAVADGALLALLHQGTADGCRWNALVPHLTGRHTYMTTTQRHPLPEWDDLIAAFHDHGVLPDDTWRVVRQKTLNRGYRRRVRARLLELRGPLRQRWDDLWLRRLDPRSPASHLPHTCHLCGECNTVSRHTRAPTGARSAPRWRRAPVPSHPRARAGARRRRRCSGASRAHRPPRTAKRAPRVPPSCGSTCT